MFENQFLATVDSVRPPEGFETTEVDDWKIHASCPVTIGDDAVLLGHAFDWQFPERSNEAVLRAAMQDAATLRRLGGRWILLDFKRGNAQGDGSFSLCYGHGMIATTAALIHEVSGAPLKYRPRYDAKRLFKRHSGFLFTASDTEVEGVAALLPNHSLNLATMTATRSGPSAPRPHAIPPILTGLLQAISNRAPLALGLTAGFDSRLLAAAIKHVECNVECFTFVDDVTPDSDVEGAHWIASKIGKELRVVSAPPPEEYEGEAMRAPRYESWAQAEFSERIILSGWASEIGRNYLTWPGSSEADAQDVLKCTSSREFEDLVPVAEAWLNGAHKVRADTGIPIDELIYWELNVGRWCSAGFNILSQNNFWLTPFTCRDFIEAKLAIPSSKRGKKGRKLYTALIRDLAPELMERPVNPEPLAARFLLFLKHGLRHSAARILVALGLYRTMRKIKRGFSQ